MSWRAWFELLRFPAVFTAIADVMMGFLVTFGSLHPEPAFVMLAIASGCLYLAGMVLNDVFDADVDAVERPHRPIPSRRVAPLPAKLVGWGLLVVGLLMAAHLGYHGTSPRTTIVALALAACIVVYDGGIKRTPIGPLVMGGCRTLNVLLGMSLVMAADGTRLRPWTTSEWMLAAGLGVYIVGVTMFARSEASESGRTKLGAAIAVIIAGLATIASNAVVADAPPLKMTLNQWFVLWALLAAVIVRRCALALREPTPLRVQQAIRSCLRSIIVIDAAIVLGYSGPLWGCAVLALLVPMLLLERWASTT